MDIQDLAEKVLFEVVCFIIGGDLNSSQPEIVNAYLQQFFIQPRLKQVRLWTICRFATDLKTLIRPLAQTSTG